MASITALQLVNRVRLFRRQPEQTELGSPEDVVTLNAVNMAIDDILSTRKWDLQMRTCLATTLFVSCLMALRTTLIRHCVW
jgi:hypothetical protein